MKQLAVTMLLALLLAACASDQGHSAGSGRNPDAAWECHKIDSAHGAGRSPCDSPKPGRTLNRTVFMSLL